MTAPIEAVPTQEQSNNGKEFNFRQQQASYERKLAEERNEREKLVQQIEEIKRSQNQHAEEEDSEPYLDHKRFKKEQAKFGQQIKQETKADINQAVQDAIENERKRAFLNENPDFYDVIEKNAQSFFQKAPFLSETILKMPDNFERQKLVYHNMKAMGMDKPPVKESSIQEKIDANKRGAFYQPTQMGNPPFAPVGDFSASGMKQSYEKMKELQGRLRSF